MLLAATLGFSSPAWAFGVTVSPTRVLTEAPPGGTATFEVQFSNDSEAPLRVVAFAWDYWHGPTGRFTAPPGTTPRSAAGWIDVIPQATVVPPGEALELAGSISVPRTASGGYYAMLYVQASDPDSPNGSAVAETGTRIGVAVALDVVGTGTRSIEVERSEFTPPTDTTAANIVVVATNTGETHFPVEFKGVVRSTDGDTLGKVTSGVSRYFFPGEEFELQAEWVYPMEPGVYELAGTVIYGDDGVVPLVTPLVVPAPSPTSSTSPR